MKTLFAAAAAAALCLTAGAVSAADVVTIKLAAPVQSAKVVAGGSVWRCDGDTCTTAASEKSLSGTGCKAIVREVGPAVSYGSERKSLDEAKLTACNGFAKAAAGAQAASN